VIDAIVAMEASARGIASSRQRRATSDRNAVVPGSPHISGTTDSQPRKTRVEGGTNGRTQERGAPREPANKKRRGTANAGTSPFYIEPVACPIPNFATNGPQNPQ